MASGSANPPRDLEGGAASAQLTESQKMRHKDQLINTDLPASEQRDRLHVQAQSEKMQEQIDAKEVQIEVVRAMRSEGKRKRLSADDKEFLETRSINPDTPAAGQEAKIDKLVEVLEKEKEEMRVVMMSVRKLEKEKAEMEEVMAKEIAAREEVMAKEREEMKEVVRKLEKKTEETEEVTRKLEKDREEMKEVVRKLKEEKQQGTVTFDSIAASVEADTLRERLTTAQHVLFTSHGADWEWQDDGLTSNITAVLDLNREERRLGRSRKGTWDKQDMTQVILASGPGTGKSRALTELGKRFSQIRDNQTRIVLLVSFENGSGVSATDGCAKAIMDRVYHHLLFGNETPGGTSAWMSFQDWMEKTGGAQESFGVMLNAVAKLYTCDSVECILLIDGVHHLGGGYRACGEPSSELKHLLQKELCDLVLGSKHYVFPVCAMTSYTAAMQALKSSTTQRQYFYAPRLQRLPDGLPAAAEQYFWMTDGHGRALEAIVAVLKKGSARDTAMFLRELSAKLRSSYATLVATRAKDVDAALRAAVTRKPITTSEPRDWSLFTLEPIPGGKEGELYAAPAFVWVLLHAGSTETLLSEFDCTSSLEDWKCFEQFVAWFRGLLSKVHGEQVSVATFHKGVDWVRSPAQRMKAPALDHTVCQCANQEATTGLWKDEIETTSPAGPKKTKTLTATFINADKASSADIFTGVEYDNGEKAYETIQCKHTKLRSSESGERPKAAQPRALTAKEVMGEIKKCADPAGVFLLVSNRPWKGTDNLIKELKASGQEYGAVGVVHDENFRRYFLPTFASMWQQRKPHPSSQTASLPTRSALRSWTPRLWNTTRAPAVQPSWLPPRVSAAAPRNAVNLLLLRRATKVFS